MQYYARSPQSENISPQSYLEHVLRVLIRSKCYLRKVLLYARDLNGPAVQRILELAAEYHDLGKLDSENQSVLSGEKEARRLPISHADAGVAYLSGIGAWSSTLLVYSHHAGLPDIDEISFKGVRNKKVEQQVDQALPTLLARHEKSVRTAIRSKGLPLEVPTLKAADVRLLFSCLVHADHGDAARFSNDDLKRERPPKLRAAERLEALHHYIQDLASTGPKTTRNQMRADFYTACTTQKHEDAITICDAPVGTGKTTAVMSYLLNMGVSHKLRRVFVILPFTNIITQSAQVYRKALTLEGERGEDVVAEIHHRADFDSPASRKLTALWDAPIVVTTAVAFFETLASSSPSRLRRLQNLPGSAIFLDEAHAMLPVKLLHVAWHWIQHAANSWACRWVLASGSLCQFWKLEEFGDSDVHVSNLLPVKEQKILHKFETKRVHHLYKPNKMNLNELAVWLKELDGPVIVVLNTVHTAAAAARVAGDVLGEDNVLHLSTSLTPEDRNITLNKVRDRLKNQEDINWFLFATSCVEAGVDFSFRTGVRECASLLSLLQLAGRVNRNAEYGDANVWTITLNANDRGVTRNPSQVCSGRILRDFFEQEIEITPELCTEAMKKEMREQSSFSSQLNDDENVFAFKTVENNFQVIDDDSQLTVVDEQLIKRIHEYEDVTWRDIQNSSVRIRQNIRERLKIEESKRFPGVLLWPEGAKYSSFLGYMEAVLELGDFDERSYAII